ncbi:MAG: hypothetical protein RMI74_07215 [Thermodesulfobacterium sp.]|nr:hypothetical protein [Thermodesulfobacterium sp.]
MVREEDLKDLVQSLSIHKRAERKKVALEFFRSHLKNLRQGQEEKKAGWTEEFIRKYGSILIP